MLTYQEVSVLLNYDPATGVLTWKSRRGPRSGGAKAGSINDEGYRVIGINDRVYYAGRLAWLLMIKSWPSTQIDHKNRDRSDDRWCNLRDATRSQNCINRPANRNLGLRGTTWHKPNQKWRAQIELNGKKQHLGYFATAWLAHLAYCDAANALHGEFASAE